MENHNLPSPSSCPSTSASISYAHYNSYVYDVFINHRGFDCQKTLATDLYNRLRGYGLRVFLDQQELQEGDALSSQIRGAIQTASVHLAIFSQNYAQSSLCLDELLLMFRSGVTIIPVYYGGVKPSHLRYVGFKPEGRYARDLFELEQKTTFDIETRQNKPLYRPDTVKEWRQALSQAADIKGFELGNYDGDQHQPIQRIVESVLKNFKRPVHVARYPIGLDQKIEDFEKAVSLQPQSSETRVIGIVGLGGVGKTTLANEIFNRRQSKYDRASYLSDVSGKPVEVSQRKLLEDLARHFEQIADIKTGIDKIKTYLASPLALLIVDNVDHIDQLDALFVPLKDKLSPGSLVLITSRNKDVLIKSGIENSSIYELNGLDQQHSQELFCSHAFGQPNPRKGFREVVKKFLDFCEGLPLSLQVIGTSLYGKDEMEFWVAQLKKISKTLPDDITGRLKISYNSLDNEEKQMFLDIACFFMGEDSDTAIRIWDGSDWNGWLGLRKLQNRYLIEVDSENRIRMHDHLRDLGRDIAEEESPHRLWRGTEDLPQNLLDNFPVRGIHMTQRSGESLEGPVELGNRFINFTLSNAVVDMTNRFISSIFGHRFVDRGNRSTRDDSLLDMRWLQLQLLRAEGDCLGSISKALSNSRLVWLRWDMYPYTSLPVWIPRKKLRVLVVTGSELETLWQDESEASIPIQLRELNISSTRLLRVPESIGQLRHLEKMDLSWCRNLQMLPSSLGNLANLQYINLNGCLRLENLPDSFGNLSRLQYLSLAGCSSLTFSSITFGNIRTLETLDLSNCRRMEALPLQVTVQRYLKELNLRHTSITELPIAIGNLGNLEILRLQCPSLEMLPLGGLSSLRELTLHFCNKLRQLPESVGELTHLTTLIIHYAQIEYLPAAVMRLNNLEILKVRGCPLLEVPFNLRDSSIDKTCMIGLRQMDLQGTRLKELSFCKGVCPNLQRLNVSYCHELVVVGALPTALISLDLQECRALKEIIGLSGLAQLRLLDISGCDKIEEMPGVDTLDSLNQLRADGCNKVYGLKIKRISRDSSDVSSGKKLKQ